MLPQDIFLRLPRPTALLLITSLIDLTAAHVARQTPTIIPHRALNVAAYPLLPAPTSPPLNLQALHELLSRQDSQTVCGYVNGDAALPATCLAGSHCVVDTDHNVVGCCPNGGDSCTAGVYTTCVDPNSGPQTEVNPYVFTCTGSSVCYQNSFEGGYSQFGCGTASTQAATVVASPTGTGTSILLTSESIAFTQSPSTLASPTTLGTNTRSSDASGATTASASSSSASAQTATASSSATDTDPSATAASASSPTSSSAAPTAAPATSGDGDDGSQRTGAIVGGSIGAVVGVAALVALAAYLLRRRAGNARQGPGPRPGDTQYISPMAGGAGFAPLGPHDGRGGGLGGAATVGGKTIKHITGEDGSRNTVWQYGNVGSGGYEDRRYRGGGDGGAAGAYRGAYASPHDHDGSGDDEIPLRQSSPEIDDFSRGFHDALSRIGEEDEEDLGRSVNGAGMSGAGAAAGNNSGAGDLGDNSRPLWLQSRRQSRNLMWT